MRSDSMNQIIESERAAGRSLDDVDLARLSAALHAHINLNGRYHINPDRPPRHLTPGRDSPSRLPITRESTFH